MRILVLSQFYDPEPVLFPHDLARGLTEKGHKVSAITAIPNYPYARFYSGYHIRSWQREVRDGVPVLRLPLIPDELGHTPYSEVARIATQMGEDPNQVVEHLRVKRVYVSDPVARMVLAMLSAAASVPEDMPLHIDLGGEPALVSFGTES